MYLAGLIADDLKMSERDLQHWVAKANCATVSEYTVPWVAAESMHGREDRKSTRLNSSHRL